MVNSHKTLNNKIYDLFVVGGGVNGCGVAREAAGRGFSVCLVEMADLASGTSSGSTKLIHGGLRYLEFYEFKLVRKALAEREMLWAMAPHIIHPLRFVLPHHKGLRPAWLLRFGLFIYDHLGGRKKLPSTRVVNLLKDETGIPLSSKFTKGFEYSDCWVDDARLVILNALDAANHGANIQTQTKVISANREKDIWVIKTKSPKGKLTTYRSRVLINASGPWVDKLKSAAIDKSYTQRIRLVRGSHIVVPKLYNHDKSYILQNSDGRVFFAIPYEEDFTLIGTTDCDYEDDPANVRITAEEVDYLCNSVNAYFDKQLSSADIVWSYSAVRPLHDNGDIQAHAATRDYLLEVQEKSGEVPLINIYGGKITTYRKLAENVLMQVERRLPPPNPTWSSTTPLPGGDFPIGNFAKLVSEINNDYPFISSRHARRLVRLYGTKARHILGDCKSQEDLGRCFGSDLFELEVIYLLEHEWALRAEDIVWRRTKEGLKLSNKEIKELDQFLLSKRKLSGAKI